MTRIIYGLTGLKQHGKDTLANYLVGANPKFLRTSFAKRLREVCVKALGVDPTWIGEHKEVVLPTPIRLDAFLEPLQKVTGLKLSPKGKIAKTGREVMQFVGTDYVKSSHPTYWIDFVIAEIGKSGYAVVTDCRFPDEANALRSLGASIIRIFRTGLELPRDTHTSEALQNQITPDLTLSIQEGRLDLIQRCAYGLALARSS